MGNRQMRIGCEYVLILFVLLCLVYINKYLYVAIRSQRP